jgi:mannose-1-phosphate guanylyltransferase
MEMTWEKYTKQFLNLVEESSLFKVVYQRALKLLNLKISL